MTGKLFVNYRRDDARDMTARVRDRLAGVFGDAGIFMDVNNLMAGQRFDKELEQALAQTDVFLTVIGPSWMSLVEKRAAAGERDFVVEEIAAALNQGVVVIPVLLEGTPMPRPDDLPKEIRELALHQKHTITHERFARDVDELVEAIKYARKPVSVSPVRTSGRLSPVWIAAGSLVFLSAAGAGAYFAVLPGLSSKPSVPTAGGARPADRNAAAAAEDKARGQQAGKWLAAFETQVIQRSETRAKAEAEAKQRAEQAAKAAAEEAERNRVAAANAEQARLRAEGDTRRQSAIEAERNRIAAHNAELARQKIDEARRKSEAEAAARAKAEDDRRAALANSQRQSGPDAAKAAADAAAEGERREAAAGADADAERARREATGMTELETDRKRDATAAAAAAATAAAAAAARQTRIEREQRIERQERIAAAASAAAAARAARERQEAERREAERKKAPVAKKAVAKVRPEVRRPTPVVSRRPAQSSPPPQRSAPSSGGGAPTITGIR